MCLKNLFIVDTNNESRIQLKLKSKRFLLNRFNVKLGCQILENYFVLVEKGVLWEPDGINPISLQILVGQSDRFWLEPRYFDDTLKPIFRTPFNIISHIKQ